MGGWVGYKPSGKVIEYVDSGTCRQCEALKLTNPDPSNFKVERIEERGPWMLLEVVYPNCTNYEGRKILVMKRRPVIELLNKRWLDPHFVSGGDILARFEPTDQGWEHALKFLASL